MVGLSFLTSCDYDLKLLDLKNLPTFYHFVLRYWQDYKLLMLGNRIPPEHEIIWNNQNTLVDKKPLFYKSWFHHDIVQVQDLLNVNREFLSFADFKQKFNIDTPFTLYHGLINAIPNEWKRSIRNLNRPIQSASLETSMPTTYPSTRTAYKNILDKTFIPPTNENKVLNYGFTKENIHDVYLLPFLVTDETKLIAFQYKIIHNILPCRSSLFRAGLVDDDICPLCKLEKQSLVHMLYNCSESLLFWEKFTQWWQEKFSETIVLSVDAILFGWHQNANNKRVLNYILIIAKYYIFTTSVCDNKLSFDCFLLRLNSKLDVLRTIAIKNKSLNKFEIT